MSSRRERCSIGLVSDSVFPVTRLARFNDGKCTILVFDYESAEQFFCVDSRPQAGEQLAGRSLRR